MISKQPQEKSLQSFDCEEILNLLRTSLHCSQRAEYLLKQVNHDQKIVLKIINNFLWAVWKKIKKDQSINNKLMKEKKDRKVQ